MLGSLRNSKTPNLNIAGEHGFFLKSETARADNFSSHQPINGALGSLHRIEELDICTLLDDESAADDLPHNLAVSPDDEITRTLDSAGEITFHGEMVALDGRSGDNTFFMDEDIASCLDTAIPFLANVIIPEADVGAASPAKCRSRTG